MITMKTMRSTPVAVVLTLTGCAQVTYPELDGSGMAIRVEGNDGEVGEWRCAEDVIRTRRSCTSEGADTLFVYCDRSGEATFPQTSEQLSAAFVLVHDGDLTGRWRFTTNDATLSLGPLLGVEELEEGGSARVADTDLDGTTQVDVRAWAMGNDLTMTVVARFGLGPLEQCDPDDFE